VGALPPRPYDFKRRGITHQAEGKKVTAGMLFSAVTFTFRLFAFTFLLLPFYFRPYCPPLVPRKS
jgi:hypothetical protein